MNDTDKSIKAGGIPAQQNADPQERTGAQKPAEGQGETRWSQVAEDGKQTSAPKQPNERDESASSQGAHEQPASDMGKLAHKDAEHGTDTDRGPVVDSVYNGAVTEGHRTGDDEQVDGKRDHRKSTSSNDR